MKKAVNLLFDAKTEIYKQLMQHHLFVKTFMTPPKTKEEFLITVNLTRKFDVKLSSEQIFDVQKEDTLVDRKIDIPKPKIYAKARNQIGDDGEFEKIPKIKTDTYNLTLCK